MARVRLIETTHEGRRIIQYSHTRTVLGRPLYWVSSYWTDGLLIDTGPHHTSNRFNAAVAKHPIDAVVVTHHHEDHVGNVEAVQAGLDVDAYASTWTLKQLRTPARLTLYRRFVWGTPHPGRFRAAGRTISTRHHEFEVIHVPGHTLGDLALVEATEGWAFVGDLFLATQQAITQPGEDYAATLASLEKVARFKPRFLFTGRRVYDNAMVVLQARIAFLKQVLQQVLGLRKQGLTSAQIRRRLFGFESPLYYWSKRELSKQRFVDQAAECLFHAPNRH